MFFIVFLHRLFHLSGITFGSFGQPQRLRKWALTFKNHALAVVKRLVLKNHVFLMKNGVPEKHENFLPKCLQKSPIWEKKTASFVADGTRRPATLVSDGTPPPRPDFVPIWSPLGIDFPSFPMIVGPLKS
jgi:hypothetical protein